MVLRLCKFLMYYEVYIYQNASERFSILPVPLFRGLRISWEGVKRKNRKKKDMDFVHKLIL